jgi:hypothetical protein
VQNVKEITPRRPQLKPGPGDIEAKGADDASVISILAGAVVRAVEDVPPAAPFSALAPMVPCSRSLCPFRSPFAKTKNRGCGAPPLA